VLSLLYVVNKNIIFERIPKETDANKNIKIFDMNKNIIFKPIFHMNKNIRL